MRLDALFRPKSVAVIGASEKPTIGRRLIVSLDRIGFSGPVFPINPSYPTVLGRTCYPSIADTPEEPDVAVFCVGHRLVLDAFTAAAERGVSLLTDVSRFGFSHIVSCGNEAVLEASDFLEYLIEDPQTAVIGCFIETLRAPDRFAAALDRAAARDKPVVALKVGRTARARHAVMTHTAGEAGDSAVFSDMLRAHRAIEVADLAEFTEVLVACQGARRPAGRRLGVITSSGGLAELILDVAAANDLEVPPLPPDLQADMHRLAGYITGDGNPLDAWGNGTFVPNLDHALAALQASTDHDAVVFLRDNGDAQPMDQPETALNYLKQFARAAAASDKPHYLFHTRAGRIDPAHVACLREAGIPIVTGIREGLGAIDRLARWGDWKRNSV